MKITPVILAGGCGERLWPLSTPDYPKQFALRDASGRSLFQASIARVANREYFTAPVILCNEAHRFLVRDQLHAIGCADAAIVLEPMGRNTAPAIALAALHVAPEDVMLVMPADHQIDRPDRLYAALPSAVQAAQAGYIVTFAMTPTAAETGYGYIQLGEALSDHREVHRIARFIEKPEREVAESLLRVGGYGWNSGLFMLTAATAAREYAQHAPDIWDCCQRVHEERRRDGVFTHLPAELFATLRAIAFDRAIMERSEYGAVIPLEMGWRDLGSWAALDATTTKNAEGNAVSGSPELLDVTDSFIHCDGTHVAAIGLRDMLVVAAHGQVLIAPKHRVEEIRSVAAQMPKNSRVTRTRSHTVHRPWGQFDAMDCGEDYQVKKLTILPQGKISLQTHSQRAEHWVVVKGIATVTRGEQRYELHRNESTYIAVGERHRLENLTDEELIVIEVQTGDYLGEDDIERFEDIYARSAEA